MLSYKKILFLGGSGKFGNVFKKINGNNDYFYPSRKELDILDFDKIIKYFKKNKPDLVIHCAGLSRPMEIHDTNINLSINMNIIGTCNIVKACNKFNVKIIYFSTCAVYPGKSGNYKENSSLLPVNNYAWSKLGGEAAVKLYKNSLILRISMTEKPFIHKKAFKDLITNFMFHEEVAKILPKLYKFVGIINIGGPSQSPYNFAKKFNPYIKSIKVNKKSYTNINLSMNTKKLKSILSG